MINWEAISGMGEVVVAAAVVVSLFYLPLIRVCHSEAAGPVRRSHWPEDGFTIEALLLLTSAYAATETV